MGSWLYLQTYVYTVTFLDLPGHMLLIRIMLFNVIYMAKKKVCMGNAFIISYFKLNVLNESDGHSLTGNCESTQASQHTLKSAQLQLYLQNTLVLAS